MKPKMLIFGPIATRSGYGDMGRDIVRHLIEYDKFDISIISAPWGDTPMNALNPENPADKMIIDRITNGRPISQPEVFVHIGIPSEAQTIGKFNILCTAGIETTIASAQWIEACNRVDLILTISEHSKNVFLNSKYHAKNPDGSMGMPLELKKPVEVLHNCVNPTVIRKLEYEADVLPNIKEMFSEIPEKFNFLFVGHWLRGDLGEDRKNVGLLVKVFLETFKQSQFTKKPGLILKTSGGSFSILDKQDILRKIDMIRKSVVLAEGQTLPNVYIVHGELTDDEMNSLYNHPKVKSHVSLTKGEGFGRPLLEASVSGKPVIASGWGGHMDFLNVNDAVLIGGELKQIHPSSVWDNVLIKESSWFAPDIQQSANALAAVYSNYAEFRKKAHTLGKENARKFSYQAIQTKTWELMDKYIPEFPKNVPLTLPKLKKIELPKLKKVE